MLRTSRAVRPDRCPTRCWGAFGNAEEVADPGFIPRYLATDSALYQSLFGKHEMLSLGLDLSKSAAEEVANGFATAIPYILLVVLLGGLYFVQQRMVAARASISPTMSAGQAKLMQYLPVFFAIFQIFFLAALVVYYIFQTLLRIAQQAYITRAFYGHDEALGRQAQRAGEAAREEAKKNGESGGLFAQAKRELGGGTPKSGTPAKSAKSSSKSAKSSSGSSDAASKPVTSTTSKRVTPPKNRPTPSAGAKGRPTPTRQQAQADKAKAAKSAKATRPKSTKKSN